jgi:recombination associated protein RdgC
MKTQQLQVWAGSRKSVEEIVAALESALSLKLVPRVPGAMLKNDIDEKLLGPTAELLGVDGKELNV